MTLTILWSRERGYHLTPEGEAEFAKYELRVVTNEDTKVLDAVRDWTDGKVGLERIVQAERARREAKG